MRKDCLEKNYLLWAYCLQAERGKQCVTYVTNLREVMWNGALVKTVKYHTRQDVMESQDHLHPEKIRNIEVKLYDKYNEYLK